MSSKSSNKIIVPDAVHALNRGEKLNGRQLRELREYILKLVEEIEREK